VDSCCPCDAKDTADDASHAEAEHCPRGQEFVALASVHLEDCHVADCASEIKSQEYRDDWDVCVDGWSTSHGCGSWGIWWLENVSCVLRDSDKCQYILHAGWLESRRTKTWLMIF
jgi:hypothetical protein